MSKILKVILALVIIGLVVFAVRAYDSTIPRDRTPAAEVSAANEKLDMEVVCQSALMYTTFMSGEDADAFVAACIRGEHPEVVERYKADMGLEADAAI